MDERVRTMRTLKGLRTFTRLFPWIKINAFLPKPPRPKNPLFLPPTSEIPARLQSSRILDRPNPAHSSITTMSKSQSHARCSLSLALCPISRMFCRPLCQRFRGSFLDLM